ncbi:glucans biosynthesis glucosyltransferase MdoH [Rhodopirellula halodulae]|uniref:glucans biosynthesis glucosyltransferase MdoH n=1 Tax=Rhodopirellula halodulae TaxID=2894198 RepID=UPI001E50372C|nr:glucans biosynthesis glucosyltransferase MdoH [Rhodopirellula sp. JC737]MCC9657882.1 glucans biosynthesis glucosyltransferase MdoH [Rhodopirellula sp. JC737]
MASDPCLQGSVAEETRRIRWFIAVAVLCVGIVGTFLFAVSLSPRGINWLEWLAIPLFSILFGWIGFSFVVATMGLFRLLRARTPKPDAVVGQAEEKPTAVLVPVYNESPADVFARVEAMVGGLGRDQAFDFFVLSDTNDSEVWLAEELAWSQLMDRLEELGDSKCNVYYRHRRENISRKAGNIADFCRRWSDPYDFMIVLDADSLLEPETMTEMVRRMRDDERLGILQVPPTPIGRESLFARLQQFAAAAYGPVFCEGFDAWAGEQGNYWGHNAIIRVEAFCDCCDLPVLPGQAPLGGEILSHDFVEASLLVRSGWKVKLANDLGGSYEECPTTLTDYAMRDQRWCQGNMQHSRLLLSEGFHPTSRLHFLSGVLAYASSPLWIVFTCLCIGGWFWEQAFETEGVSVVSRLGVSASAIQLGLFATAMAMLLIPKFYGYLATVARGRAWRFGGAFSMLGSVLFEIVMSVLLSPIMAILHTRFVVSTLRGRKVRWASQQRGEHGVTLGQAFRDYGVLSMLGIGITAAAFAWAPSWAVWFLPVTVGLILAVPLAMALASRSIGKMLARVHMLVIPQEVDVPDVYQIYAQSLLDQQKYWSSLPKTSMLEQMIEDPNYFHIHHGVVTASESQYAMTDSQRMRIRESSRKRSGANPISFSFDFSEVPDELRRSLLSDVDFLREMHVGKHAQPKRVAVAAG